MAVASPLISIFMPVYNGADFLNDSIKSVLEQTYENFELLCVDDSSTDNSFQILEHFSSLDKRVMVFQKKNGGNVPKSFNYVLPFIKGDFYFYMSQDDIISPDLFENAIIKYQQTGSDVIVPTCKFVGGDGEDGSLIKLKDDTTISGKEAFLLCIKWQMHGFNLVNMQLLKGEHLDESIFNSDEFLTFRYLFKANGVSSCKGTFYYNRGNPNSITKTPKPYRVQRLITNQAIYSFIRDNSIALPSWIHSYWYNVMIQSFFRIFSYIKSYQMLWSENDRHYVKSVFLSNWNEIKNDVPGDFWRYPRSLIKFLYLKFWLILLKV